MASLETVLKSKPIADPHMRAFLNIMVTGAWLEGRMNALLKPHGLTEPQFNVLRILRGQQGASMNLYEISERMVHPTSNVSRIIDKLLEKGWVSRKACEENRRRVDITVTPIGLKLLQSVQPAIDSHFQEFATKLSEEDAQWLSTALEAVRNEPEENAV
jgi:DNA-binding MarR family transcriptional regulator